MTLIGDLRDDLEREIDHAINSTDKEIVKGTVTCRGCPYEKEARIENIGRLIEYAVQHAEESVVDINNGMVDHPVGFDVSLMPRPEIENISQEIKVGGDE